MNDREYLRSLGYKVGDRGRMSAHMKQLITDRHGGDEPPVANENDNQYKSMDKMADGRWAIERSNNLPNLVKQSVVMRSSNSYQATLIDGLKIGVEFCSNCKDHVMHCQCEDGPHPPRYLNKKDIAVWSVLE